MHDSEENGINSALYDALKLYRDNKVFQHFGVSWTDMKQLTHEEFTMILELSADMTKKESSAANAALGQLEDSLNLKNK